MTYVVEDLEDKNKLTDFMSFTFFEQQCLNKQDLGHGWDTNLDAQMYYYSFQKNTYLDMMK